MAKIVRAAGVFAIVPDIDKITALDPSEGPFFGMSVADIWDYEIHDYGWLGRGITLVALLFRRAILVRRPAATGRHPEIRDRGWWLGRRMTPLRGPAAG